MSYTIGLPAGVRWLMAVIPATQEAEIERITVPVQPRQNVSEISSQLNKLGVVVHPSLSSQLHWEAIGRRIVV
jgi:acetolactate synthase small subunit